MSQLKWPEILPIALRMKAAKAVANCTASTAVLACDKDAHDVLSRWNLSAHAQVRAEGSNFRTHKQAAKEGSAIDSYFSRVRSDFSEWVNDREFSGRAKELVSLLMEDKAPDVCAKCCASVDPVAIPCRWVSDSATTDRHAVSSRGECLSHLRTIFRLAEQVSRNAYGLAEVGVPQTLELHTSYGSGNKQLELHFDASTRELRPEVRAVTFSFDVSRFWTDDIHALPYISVHECVAHGFCGVEVDSADSSLSVEFHEGWMDCVAAGVVRTELSVGKFRSELQNCKAVGEALQRVLELRYRCNGSHSIAPWRFLAGREAYQAFVEIACDAFGSRTDPYVRISAVETTNEFLLKVNSSTCSHKDRSDFHMFVSEHFCTNGNALTAEQEFARLQLVDWLREFSQDRDAMRLLSRILDNA